MVRNVVNLPTLGVVDHVLNSKLASEPFKKTVFDIYKLDPKHDPIFIEHNFKHSKVYLKVHTRIAHVPA